VGVFVRPPNTPRRWAQEFIAPHQPAAASTAPGRSAADEVVDPGSNDPVASIRELTHGRYVDLTLDTSSNPDARLNAIRSTRCGAPCALSAKGGEVHIYVSPHLFARH